MPERLPAELVPGEEPEDPLLHLWIGHIMEPRLTELAVKELKQEAF